MLAGSLSQAVVALMVCPGYQSPASRRRQGPTAREATVLEERADETAKASNAACLAFAVISCLPLWSLLPALRRRRTRRGHSNHVSYIIHVDVATPFESCKGDNSLAVAMPPFLCAVCLALAVGCDQYGFRHLDWRYCWRAGTEFHFNSIGIERLGVCPE